MDILVISSILFCFFQMKRKGVILRSILAAIKVQFHTYGVPMSTVVDCYQRVITWSHDILKVKKKNVFSTPITLQRLWN